MTRKMKVLQSCSSVMCPKTMREQTTTATAAAHFDSRRRLSLCIYATRKLSEQFCVNGIISSSGVDVVGGGRLMLTNIWRRN